MTKKRYVFLVAIVFGVLAIAYLLDGELWGEKTILAQTHSGQTIRVVRVVRHGRADAYLYSVVSENGNAVGPYYIAPAYGKSFSLQLVNLTDTSFCIVNRNRPDDVYCYVEATQQIYYPSPDCSVTAEDINKILVKQYRPASALTSLVESN